MSINLFCLSIYPSINLFCLSAYSNLSICVFYSVCLFYSIYPSILSIYSVYQSILLNYPVYLSICVFYSIYLHILFYIFFSIFRPILSICLFFSIYLLILCNLSAYSILSITLIYGLLHPIIHPSILPKKKFTQLVSKFFLFHFRQRCRFVWSARVALKEAATANTAPSAASNVSFFALILIMQKLCERLALWNKWFSFAWRRWIQSHSARDSPWWHSNKLLFFYLLLCTTTSSTADAELFA